MAHILCIETSTKTCSVGLSSHGVIGAMREDRSEGYSHAEQLNVFIDEVMREAGLGFGQLDGIAISGGPGSYTGLRIGTSAAKGIAFAKGIPLIAIDPLKAMAAQVVENNKRIDNCLLISMIDARRMEVFCAGFTPDLSNQFATRAEILEALSFPEAVDFPEVLYFGDGASKAISLLSAKANFHYVEQVYASALGMAALAEASFAAGDFVDVAYFEPFYLKDFVAGKPKKGGV